MFIVSAIILNSIRTFLCKNAEFIVLRLLHEQRDLSIAQEKNVLVIIEK
jgi:hypothetical protein